jgi:hypothetical protein
MKAIEDKLKRAIEMNKLNLEKLDERQWYNYFIHVSELVWERNFYHGYQIEVYIKKCGDYLAAIKI